MDSEVVVRGEAELRTMPDWALLRVTIRGEGASRDEAYRNAAVDASAVDEVLTSRQQAGRSVAHGALVVQPKSRWKKGESVRTGWFASRTTTVEITEFELMGDIFAELAAAGGDVAAPDWQIDPKNCVYQHARKDAAIDARQRADAYADALGLKIGSVHWVAEPGLRGPGEVHPVVFAAAAGMTRGGPAAEDVINVSPREMTVRAAVEVGFVLTTASQAG